MAITDLPPPGLLDRGRERAVLDRLVAGVRTGQSRVLVLRGEAGSARPPCWGSCRPAREAAETPGAPAPAQWARGELVEAGVRSGMTELAVDALERLSEVTQASGTDWALGIEARSRALLSDGEAAERLYREAIERLGRTRLRGELARARLL